MNECFVCTYVKASLPNFTFYIYLPSIGAFPYTFSLFSSL